MSGSSNSVPAPDPGIGQAAMMNAQLGQQWLNFAQNAYSTETQRQAGIDALDSQVEQQQLGASTEQQQWAEQAHNQYETETAPLIGQYTQQAENYDTPAKEQEAAATAKADVAENASQTQAANQRQEAAMGVNPASGRWAGIDRATALGTAVSEAGAENQARQQVKTTGLGLEANAINAGSGLPTQAEGEASLGLNAGTSATGIANAGNSQFLAGTGIMNTGFQGGMQGYANEGNLLQNEYNSELQGAEFQDQLGAEENQGIMSTIGSIAGLGVAGYMMSSKKVKNNKRASKGNLDAVRKMPVGRWNYKPGVADGGAAEHVGPYAEDFRKATGLGDGKTIPMQDAIGVSMGAINELADKLDQVHKAVGLGQATPKITPIKQQGGKGGNLRVAKVAGTKPPKLTMKKPPQVKAQPRPQGLPQYRPLARINPNRKAA